ncbi:MAG TPA: hypothetical protein VLG72_02525 [Nitrospirota bacterium]|nr:hypothetical protein [Nitrospirota bacterium]
MASGSTSDINGHIAVSFDEFIILDLGFAIEDAESALLKKGP